MRFHALVIINLLDILLSCLRPFQASATGQLDCVYDWILNRFRMYPILAAGRVVSSRLSQHPQLCGWLIQSGRHVHRNQNIPLSGKGT